MSTPTAPLPPPEPRPPRLPLVSLIAPAVLSLVFLVVLRSPFALIIGVLGPVMALSQWWEAKRATSKTSAEAWEDYQQQLSQFADAQRAEDEAFRRDQIARFPAVSQWALHPLWRAVIREGQPVIRLGETSVAGPSGSVLVGMPATLQLGGAISVVGGDEVSRRVWRVVALGLLACHRQLSQSPDTTYLPPRAQESIPEALTLAGVRAEWTPSLEQVSHGARIVLIVHSAERVELYQDGVVQAGYIRPDLIAEAHAQSLWRELLPPQPERRTELVPPADSRGSLVISLNHTEWLDLVTDGPHAVVWGQTGSGKTMVLRTMIRSIASRYRPDQVQCVVIDFKGGLGVSDLEHLPHLVGVLTDLDSQRVGRVRDGITAEIQRRERLLASSTVADIANLDEEVACPRTVIIIDEVAALIRSDAEWSSLLADLAARGRALGLHLVIAGQRIVGQIPAEVLANSPLRVCLRVSSLTEASDFLSGVPTEMLQQLPGAQPGVALVSGQHSGSRVVKVDTEHPGEPRGGVGQPLWKAPLSDFIESTDRTTFAVVDEPLRQRQQGLATHTLPTGLVWGVGDPGAGHTSALARIAETLSDQVVVPLPTEPCQLINALITMQSEQIVGEDHAPHTFLIDRLDRLLSGVEQDVGEWVVEQILTLAGKLADHREAGRVVVTTLGYGGVARQMARSHPPTFFLRHSHREHWLHWGLAARVWSPQWAPGRMSIGGQLAQIVAPGSETPEAILPSLPAITLTQLADTHWRLVTTSQRAESFGAGPSIVHLGDMSARWQELDAAFQSNTLLLCGLPSSALRGQVRLHQPLPATPVSHSWRVGVAGVELVNLVGN